MAWGPRLFALWLVASLPAIANPARPGQGVDGPAARFAQAWQAAASGRRTEFERLRDGLTDYVLHPYLRYEDLRQRRDEVAAGEMADFLDAHRDWAFTAGLRAAWLRSLGRAGRWTELIRHAGASASADAEILCHLAHARLRTGETAGLQAAVQALWAVGHSQHDACDPVFEWLRAAGGITPELAWRRVQRAMQARNAGLTAYLSRFVPGDRRVWVERWLRHDRSGYLHLAEADRWDDEPEARDIVAFGLAQLARRDADRAWTLFERLDGRFAWDALRRGELIAELALWSAVANALATPARAQAVPASARSDRLFEWLARHGLAQGDWALVRQAVAALGEVRRGEERWRYWAGRAHAELGDRAGAASLLESLSASATYYGFLAADHLQRPYVICPSLATVDPAALAAFRQRPVVQRIVELERVGLRSWARAEWQLMTRRASPADLRLAAAVAHVEQWHDRAILALAASGDLHWYAWRYPLAHASLVVQHAAEQSLDPAWVLGLVRAESAMATDAVSPAGARGLMQLMPATARAVAGRQHLAWRGGEQLFRAEDNIRLGTAFLRELLDRFGDEPVAAAAAYNAGPGAAQRWREQRAHGDPAMWIETLPYPETREYIPRILAFATIYDWRLERPVRRITARMEGMFPTAGAAAGFADVACPNRAEAAAGS